MSLGPLYPLTFDPILKSLIWGGRRLGTILHKAIGPGDTYAESWEISDHGEDVSRVNAGPLAGTGLRALIHEAGDDLLGKGRSRVKADQFPLLVKFLDANDVLSVQVHPDDALGRKLAGDNGKTETWVIVHAEPGSLIYAGLKLGVRREEFAEALASNTVEPLLHRFEAKAGDCIMIPAGTVHAIGAGVVLAEIQQMSDATFRVYDWGRVGPEGKPRQLHIAQALEATNFDTGPVSPLSPVAVDLPDGLGTRERLSRCEYFALERFRIQRSTRIGAADRFTIVIGLGGEADLRYQQERIPIALGRTVLIPASVGPCEVEPRSGEVTLLTCIVP